jgi:hypothetical protein
MNHKHNGYIQGGENRARPFGHDFFSFSFYFFSPPKKMSFVFFLVLQLIRAQLMGPTIPGGLPPGLGGAAHDEATSSKRKRDKYTYEVECITDVPIGCILKR